MVGLFFILLELEKFFEDFIKPILPSENNKIFEKRFYLDIKKRIFNIFYYFGIGPETLNFWLNSLLLFIINNKINFKFSITSEELDWVIEDCETRKKSLILEFNKQFNYNFKKNNIVKKTIEPKKLIKIELSPDYVQGLEKKNKYKFPYDYIMYLNNKSIDLKKMKILKEQLKESLKEKRKKRVVKKYEKNLFENYHDWL